MKILLLGASGTAGTAALPPLLSAGHDVTAVSRSPERAAGIRRCRVVTGDPTDPATLRGWLAGVDLAVDLRIFIPAGARGLRARAWRPFVDIRDRQAGQLVDAAIDAGVPRVLHDTVSFVYADGGDRWLDEDAPVDAPGAVAANVACEQHLARLTAAGGTGVALRLASFYGPTDAASRDLAAAAARGQAFVFGRPEAWHSYLHTDDAGRAVAAAADALGADELPAGVYNVADGAPLRVREVVRVLADGAGRGRLRTPPGLLPRIGGASLRSIARSSRVDATRFRRATGWEPAVPSFRDGWLAATTGR